MKSEYREQEQIGLTPRRRLDCLNAIMLLTDFGVRRDELLDGEELENLETLQSAADLANDEKVQQYYFEKLKTFFIEKLNYEPTLFTDDMLTQFLMSFEQGVVKEQEKEDFAKKIAPDLTEQIWSLRHEQLMLRIKEPQNDETRARIHEITRELRVLNEKREKIVKPTYDKKHKIYEN